MKKSSYLDSLVLEAAGVDREICKNCRFFYREWDQGVGNCHRHAPLVVTAQCQHQSTDRLVWPEVEEDDYCGDFKRALKVKDEKQ